MDGVLSNETRKLEMSTSPHVPKCTNLLKSSINNDVEKELSVPNSLLTKSDPIAEDLIRRPI